MCSELIAVDIRVYSELIAVDIRVYSEVTAVYHRMYWTFLCIAFATIKGIRARRLVMKTVEFLKCEAKYSESFCRAKVCKARNRGQHLGIVKDGFSSKSLYLVPLVLLII